MAKKQPRSSKAPKSSTRGKKPAAPAKLPKPVVGSVVVQQATKQPVAVRTRATPPRIDRPQRIHARRFPPRVAEGEERAFHSTTVSMRGASAMAASPGEDVRIVLNTELTGPGKSRTASNVGEPSTAINDNVVLYTGNWYAAIST